MSELLRETKTISLEVGAKMLVVGANPSGIQQFQKPGEDRYHFMDVHAVKQAKEFPHKNFQLVIVNGRIQSEVQEKVQTLADRSQTQDVLVVADSSSIQRMMEKYPFGNKGVATFEVPDVIQQITLRTPNHRKAEPAPNNPPPPEPPLLPDPADVKPAITLQSLLDQLEQLYNETGGDHKKVIARFREAGFDDNCITNGALYQRCLAIKNRNHQVTRRVRTKSTELIHSGKAAELLTAIETAKASQQSILELATQVADENQQLKVLVTDQAKELENLPALQQEIADLRKRVAKAKELFGA